MPKITITTQESSSVSSISATSTVVLIPLFLKPGEEMSVGYYGKNYPNDFAIDWENRILTYTADKKAEPSYEMAKLLISSGLNILVQPLHYGEKTSEGWPDINQEAGVTSYAIFREKLALDLNNKITAGLYSDFSSVNSYNVSYVTSGAYQNFMVEYIEYPPNDESSESRHKLFAKGCYSDLNAIAVKRGDCIAMLEIDNYSPNELLEEYVVDTGSKTILNMVPNNQNCAIFYPWCSFGNDIYPAGLAYLKAFGNSLQTNPDWMAAAGVLRGLIPDCTGVMHYVSETFAEKLQSTDGGASINPIMNINNYGLRVWGNRTGINTTSSYYAYLNIKVLANLIRKQIYNAASYVTFEPNDEITWVNFKSMVNTLLDKMVSGRGIRSYSWTRNAVAAKATINASLTITPIEAVENFTINIDLKESSETGTVTAEII